jgi:predicted ribosome quality control (RQC) complex YloA/Tae2 family protein
MQLYKEMVKINEEIRMYEREKGKSRCLDEVEKYISKMREKVKEIEMKIREKWKSKRFVG